MKDLMSLRPTPAFLIVPVPIAESASRHRDTGIERAAPRVVDRSSRP
jgi:hypothetical protein